MAQRFSNGRLSTFWLRQSNQIAFLCIFMILLYALLHFGRFSAYNYDTIEENQILSSLAMSNMRNHCIVDMAMLRSFDVFESFYLTKNMSDETTAGLHNVQEGGYWSPKICNAMSQIYLIIPFRNRHNHLNKFLRIMHPFLQAQNVSYMILVVEQTSGVAFNRAKLFNVGYQELKKLHGFLGCLIFHDVDLIPLDGRNIYGCLKGPRALHMSAHLDNFRFNLPYEDLFGGAVSVEQSIFEDANGFSNKFYGWGAEDDNFSSRLTSGGNDILRYSPSISRYSMLRHRKEVAPSNRTALPSSNESDFEAVDGIRQLEYNLVSFSKKPLFTHVLVNL